MIIVNGKRHYKKDLDKLVKVDGDGWDNYDGRNYQWYSLYYNKETGLVKLEANNSGSCYGDYSTRYFNSPREFVEAFNNGYEYRNVGELLGEINEDDENVMAFVNAAFPDKKTA